MKEENSFFTVPDVKYKDTYIAGRREFQREGKHYLDYDTDDVERNFSDYIKKWNDESKGINLKKGWVPQTNFWLIVDGVYVGCVSVRHFLDEKLLRLGGHIGYDIVPSQRRKGYGTKMLKHALIQAKEMGLDRVLLTCDEDNTVSRKIIEKSGGIFENAVLGENATDPRKYRYWVDL